MSTKLECAIALQALLAVDMAAELRVVEDFEKLLALRTEHMTTMRDDVECKIKFVLEQESEIEKSIREQREPTTIKVGPSERFPIPPYRYVDYFSVNLAQYRRSKAILALVDRLTSPASGDR